MLKRWQISRREWVLVAGLALVTAFVFGAMVWRLVWDMPGSDYTLHIQFARNIAGGGEFPDTHILFQGLIIGLSAVLPVSYELAGWMVAVVFYVIAALILYALFRTVMTGIWRVIAAIAAPVLLLVTPIILFELPERHFYFGYVGVNVPHNPTMVLLKPFALLLYVFSVAILKGNLHFSAKTVAAGTALVFISALAKPNYLLVLLPALLLVVVYRFFRRETRGLNTIIIALIVPMILVLALQYLVTYTYLDRDESSIIFAPLQSILAWDHFPEFLPLKFLLSILFPLVVYLLYWRYALRDVFLNLAWLTFFVGAAQMYLFAESGKRLVHGNFWWSAQISLFILFVATMLFWLRHFKDRPYWRSALGLGVFALHTISGMIVYIVQFRATAMGEWW